MENKIKFLEMIQEIIKRMASNSFMLKGWTVTLVVGMLALLGDESNRLFMLTYVPIVMFWFLDSYYLQLERKYRKLYDITRKKEEEDIDFDLVVVPSDVANKTCFFQSLLSSTEVGFYLPTTMLVTIIFILSLR